MAKRSSVYTAYRDERILQRERGADVTCTVTAGIRSHAAPRSARSQHNRMSVSDCMLSQMEVVVSSPSSLDRMVEEYETNQNGEDQKY